MAGWCVCGGAGAGGEPQAAELCTDFERDASADAGTDATVAFGKTCIYRGKGLRDNGHGGDSNRATVTIP